MKVWMITGAGRGLGRAFVKEAVEHGDSVTQTPGCQGSQTDRHKDF